MDRLLFIDELFRSSPVSFAALSGSIIVPSRFKRQRAGSTARVVGAATAVAYRVLTQNLCPKRETGAETIRSEKPLIDLRDIVNTQTAFARSHISVFAAHWTCNYAGFPVFS